MKVGITGASGLVGWNLFKYLREQGVEVLGTYASRPRPGLIKWDLRDGDPALFDDCTHVVLSAAISNLDRCLSESELAYSVNVEGNFALLERIKSLGHFPIFFSSDQVFDGRRGNYKETDEISPVNVYGAHKAIVELYLQTNFQKYLIMRLSKTYSRNPEDGGVFFDIVRPLRKKKIVRAAFNQIYNPSPVEFVCDRVYRALSAGLVGIYHLAQQRALSRFELAVEFAKSENLDQNLIERVDLMTVPVREKRALNSSLDVSKLESAIRQKFL